MKLRCCCPVNGGDWWTTREARTFASENSITLVSQICCQPNNRKVVSWTTFVTFVIAGTSYFSALSTTPDKIYLNQTLSCILHRDPTNTNALASPTRPRYTYRAPFKRGLHPHSCSSFYTPHQLDIDTYNDVDPTNTRRSSLSLPLSLSLSLSLSARKKQILPYEILSQWFSSRRSEYSRDGWQESSTRGGGGVERREAGPRVSYSLPWWFSWCVYGASRRRRHHGVGWSRLEVATSIESPIGWEMWAPEGCRGGGRFRLEVRGKRRTLRTQR